MIIKLGVLGDIHGNYEALKAVLKVFDDRHVDRKVCLGDLVGYFHQSIEVLDVMMASGIPTIMGNHDAYVLGRLPCPPDKWDFISLEYVKQRMSAAHRQWLSTLPLSLQETADNQRIEYFHGSPWDPLGEYIYPDHASFDRFASLDCDFVFLGHSHHPLLKKVGRCTVVNPGSCGQPRHGDHRACAAILDTADGRVEFLNVDYDVKKFINEARHAGIPEKVINVLERSAG